MVMDGAEDVEEPESRGMFRTVLAEASSIVHSMFGKLILDFTKIHHNLPSALKPSDEWTAFESRFDKLFRVERRVVYSSSLKFSSRSYPSRRS
jgi:hypothetical protein